MTSEPYDVSNGLDQLAAFWASVDQREAELIGRLHDEHAGDEAEPQDATTDGCDCTELCSMGPNCPGGILARLPGTGCWRTQEVRLHRDFQRLERRSPLPHHVHPRRVCAMNGVDHHEQKLPCECPPCPGRGNDGHGMTHCAECCFGSGVEADMECPIHGVDAIHDAVYDGDDAA